MKIKGVDGLTIQDVQDEVYNGGKFVMYTYCISIIVMTFKRRSNIYFIRSNENAVAKSIPYTLLSFTLGWWGIPWGIIYTVGALGTNFSGGKNVTTEIMQHLQAQTKGPVLDAEQDLAIQA